MWKGSKGLLKALLWERVGGWTELQHIDPHSSGHNSVSFLFSRAAQPGAWGPASLGHGPHSSVFSPTRLNSNCSIGAWGPPLLGTGFLYRILSPTDLTSCLHPGYIIVRRPPSSCGGHKSHSFNPSTVKVISWYSSTGCTCYLHRCISYFDRLVGVNYTEHLASASKRNIDIICIQEHRYYHRELDQKYHDTGNG